MTRHFGLALAIVLLVCGCGHPPEPQFRSTVQGPLAVVRGEAGSFVPLVPASDKPPRCEDLRNVPPGMGARVVSFTFGDAPEQKIAVVLGDDGEPRNYSDTRGDLNGLDGREGDRTSIVINLVQGHALGLNQPEGREPEAVRFQLDDALDAVNLGEPRRMIDKILATCVDRSRDSGGRQPWI